MSELIDRREALSRLTLLLGGTLVGSSAYLRGSPLQGKTLVADFAADEIALLDEIGETIIPTTDTPGAKAVGIGAFMVMMVRDCYNDAQHATFKAGLDRVEAMARKEHGNGFVACTPEQRATLLAVLDGEQREQYRRDPKSKQVHFFRMMKQLTVLGYFTSEIGATQALRHTETPGRYDGNVPYKKGDRAWFVQTSGAL